ncbi:MAG: response regulator [Burkholderiaceae bacterium]|jgi:DNA-binding NarL/FixJ family response regulator|nr:response regulator [Burkholderiaceae bacterium]
MIATPVLRTYLVEDNATIRDNLIATLEELAGITVLDYAETEQQSSVWLTGKTGANDGPSPDNPPPAHPDWDLAIVDLFLKQGCGLGVLQACRQRAPYQKVVVLSNYATPDIRAHCLQLGADAVFDKSQDIDALIEFCRTLLNCQSRP